MNNDDALKAAADGHSVTVGENASWLLTVESVVRTYLEVRAEDRERFIDPEDETAAEFAHYLLADFEEPE